MKSSNNPTRSSALSFYSGKVPTGAGVKKKKSTSSAIALMKENASLPPPKLKPEPLKIPSYTRPTPKPAPTQVPPPVSAGVQKKKKTNKRPSLSEQLAAIGNSASDLTSQIKKTHNLDGDNHKNNNKPLQKALLAAGAQNFTVGKLTCKFPSPVNFFNDRCTYVFHHPYEPKEINMVMFYADLKNVSVVGKTLKFKIGHPLSEFSNQNDYDHTNPSHYVSIVLGSTLDLDVLRTKIIPLVRGGRKEGGDWKNTSMAVRK